MKNKFIPATADLQSYILKAREQFKAGLIAVDIELIKAKELIAKEIAAGPEALKLDIK